MHSLFPASAKTSRRDVCALLLAVLAGAAVSLLRSRGPGALNTIWIEDAHVFLNNALNDGIKHNLFKSLNGYYHIGPRVLAEIAAAFPISWSAPLLSLFAALIISAFGAVVYLASGPFLQKWWLRLLVAAPLVLLPLGRTQADNDVATLQFSGLYVLFWVLLWRPATRAGKAVAVAVTLFVAFSSIIPLVLLPLVLLRAWVVRDRLVPLCYAAGMGLHLLSNVLGKASRSNLCCPRYEPFWAIEQFATKALPRNIFGERWLGGPGVDGIGAPLPYPHLPAHTVLMIAAWALVAGAIACAVTGLTRPHWPLAALAAGYSLLLYATQITNMGIVQPRYLIAPALLVLTALAALLRPDGAAAPPAGERPRARWPALALIGVLTVGVVANYRVDNGRSTTQPWSEILRDARASCAATGQDYTYHREPEWWHITIPCDRL